jgi:2-keto-4-pentenoate hydratase/2-oxohepta-3-ene-1,7-dioic acid hydratase in catechol pathway
MKIICIGRNYIDHAKELNNAVPDEPVFFMKPETSLLRNNEAFYLPDFSEDMQYELELVIKINKVGKFISKEFAPRYYDEIGLGIDFTARDVQRKLKEKGLPWEKAKAFDHSSPISKEFVKKTDLDLKNIDFRLDINGKTVQKGNSKNMIFDFDTIISYVSGFITFKIGDLIYTGTPAGVGKVNIGDRLEAYLNEKKMFDFYIK